METLQFKEEGDFPSSTFSKPIYVSLPLFKPGTKVHYEYQYWTIESIMISGYKLLVKLYGNDKLVNSDLLSVEPTLIRLK